MLWHFYYSDRKEIWPTKKPLLPLAPTRCHQDVNKEKKVRTWWPKITQKTAINTQASDCTILYNNNDSNTCALCCILSFIIQRLTEQSKYPSLLGGKRSRRKSPPLKWSGPDRSLNCAGPSYTQVTSIHSYSFISTTTDKKQLYTRTHKHTHTPV